MNSGSRSKSGTSQASPSASQCGAPPPRSRSSSTTSRCDCARARGCYENENGIHWPPALPKRALLIAGPTASGKSALALEGRAVRNGVIINADALQVYAALRILSARPSPEEEALAPHRLYGHVRRSSLFGGAAGWPRPAAPSRRPGAGPAAHRHRRHRALFPGARTGLSPVPPIPAEIRAHWRSFTRRPPCRTAARDPAMAARLAHRPAAHHPRAGSGRRHRPLAAHGRRRARQAPCSKASRSSASSSTPRDEL